MPLSQRLFETLTVEIAPTAGKAARPDAGKRFLINERVKSSTPK
jgi:hypothetical protein